MKLSKVVLEIHYDNPTTAAGKVDTSGFRAYYVNTPRTHDAGMIRLGDPLVSAGKCSRPRTRRQKAAGGKHSRHSSPVHMPRQLHQRLGRLRSHEHHRHLPPHALSGSERCIWSTMTRLGTLKASTRADRVDFWDNGYQQFNWLDTPIVVAKGESLQTHCFFDTTQRSSQSNFGSGTPDEMCMHSLHQHYPIHTKGVDSDGDAVLFGDCGGRAHGWGG